MKHVLKQRIMQYSTMHKPQFLQSVHRQFYKRRRNLDYLLWLEQNGTRYTAGICIMAFLLSTAIVWQNSESRIEDSQVTIQSADLLNQEKEENILFQLSAVNSVPKTQSNTKQKSEVQQCEADIEQPQKATVQYWNPLYLSGYQAPCSGMLIYNYGLGYDPVYEDYRYHRELCYEKGNGAVYACIDGKVHTINLDRHWQLAIESNESIVWYSGLQNCHKTIGALVVAGELIGTTAEKVYIQAEKK